MIASDWGTGGVSTSAPAEDWWIFWVGASSFILVIGGVIFTFMELRRLERLYPND